MRYILKNHCTLPWFIGLILFISVGCSDTPPTCSIISPGDNSKIVQGNTVNITIDATDQDGELKEVKLFIDNIGVVELKEPPYTYQWNSSIVDPGIHSLKAKSFDNVGNYSEDIVEVEIIGNDLLHMVTTLNATSAFQNNAILNARIETNTNDNITEFGFYWSDPYPGINDNIEIVEKDQDYRVVLNNLNPNTRYFFIAYSEN